MTTTTEPTTEQPIIAEPQEAPTAQTSRKPSKAFWLLLVILVIAWIVIRPGVFTVQPIGALPEGVTFVYYGRGSEMPFFSSPDGLCLEIQGGVSLFCRMGALAAASDLTDRIIVRLPYSHWAYLRSTGGLEFEE